MDHLTTAHRSWNMSRIRGRDTGPERAVRSLLHRLGYRFRLHGTKLPGRPDIVLARYRTVVLVHGCFWHRHRHCPLAYTPKSRTKFWSEKFAGNMARDRRTGQALRRLGWHVIVVWECEVRDGTTLSRRLHRELRQRAKIGEQ
jgi:DNA mismatch endonuclease, patch repair protein